MTNDLAVTTTAEYDQISVALKSFWKPFTELMEEIDSFARHTFGESDDAQWQFFTKFHDRIMTMDVTVTLLSQALCEAEINAILAVGFVDNGLAGQYSAIERMNIRKKWLEYPKKFCRSYELSKDSELYKTLDHLIEHRNSWMHHKIHLSVGEEKIIEGSSLQGRTYQERMYWLRRYFSLPYDLAIHAHSHTQQPITAIMFYTRNPIPIFDAHN